MRGRAGRFIRFIPALALGGSALVFAMPSASAASGTAATFSLTAGTLSISQPSTATLGSTAVGSLTFSGSLGPVTVTDMRGSTLGWTASVVSTDFTTGATPGTYQTVAASSIAYASGTGTAATGDIGTFTTGVVPSMSSTTAGTAGIWVGTGNNIVTWNPTLTFTLSPSQVAGTYSGTVTHSVA